MKKTYKRKKTTPSLFAVPLRAYESKWSKETRPARGSHSPNTFWYYNNWDFNALGTIFERETLKSLFEAFYRRIAKPIEMEDFRVEDGKYIKEYVSTHTAYPFWMSTRDRARFGLLYLTKGNWKGKQIIPEKWIEDSIKPYSKVNRGEGFGRGDGYGYMWWCSNGDWHLGNKLDTLAFSARGYWEQYIVVIPSFNLVIVQTSDISAGDKNASGEKFNELLKLILRARK